MAAQTSQLDSDVVVIGGGLAGRAACIHLARTGMKVTCIEPRTEIGQPVGESLDWSSPELLKSLGLRRRGVTVISCPSCARQQFPVIKTVEVLEERLAHITTPLTLSVIGCVVNGPGEARDTDIGFTGGGNNTHQVYISGAMAHRLKDQNIVDHLVDLVEKKAAELEAAKAKEDAAAEPVA